MTGLSTFITYNGVSTFVSDVTRLLALKANRIILALTALVTRLLTTTTNNLILTVTSKMSRLKTTVTNVRRNETSLTTIK